MRAMIKFILVFCFLGVIIPLLFSIISLGNFGLGFSIALDKIRLIFWPTSIIGLAGAENDKLEFKLFLIALLSNCLLYSGIGALIWLGLKKHFIFLILAGVVVIFIWWKILFLT